MILNDFIEAYETLHKYNKKSVLIVILVDHNLRPTNVLEYNCDKEAFTEHIRSLPVRTIYEPDMEEIGIIYQCVVQISK